MPHEVHADDSPTVNPDEPTPPAEGGISPAGDEHVPAPTQHLRPSARARFLIWLLKRIRISLPGLLPKERAVRHGREPGDKLTLKRILRAICRIVVASCFYLAPLIGYAIWGRDSATFSDYLVKHLGLLVMPALPVVEALAYSYRNYRRTHPPTPSKGSKKRQAPKRASLPRTTQHVRDVNDIIANLDYWPLRLIYLALIITALWITGKGYPLSPDMFIAAAENLATDDPTRNIEAILVPLLASVAAFHLPRIRTAYVIHQRRDEVEKAYFIAKEFLGYRSKVPKDPTGQQVAEVTPWLAINVRKWWALYEIDTAFVLAPEALSVSKLEAWGEFEENINSKLPRPEEWRIHRDRKGRGAVIGPANYPTSVLWDGEIQRDPLTFWVGTNLENGKSQYLTLGEVSPHIVISGGTSSGKTSLAEIIGAQCLLKPMPWDPTLRGTLVLVDPKGPLANRWVGRPGVIVANGNIPGDIENEDGDYPIGQEVMADLMRWLVDEQSRREAILHRYPNAATWMALPDHVKREHQLAPIIVILDEFLEHTAKSSGALDAETQAAEAAHKFIAATATKQAQRYRNVGMHSIVISQRANMTEIGARLMTNMPARCVTGWMDRPQMSTMFGTEDYPRLPTSKTVIENGERKDKTIPGRARLMNAGGQDIHKIQVPWFGGDENTETLDKWLPRGKKPLNGDFSPPDAQVRTAKDFDDDGNLIAEDTTATGGEARTASPGTDSSTAEAEPVEAATTLPPSTGNDPDAVFPAASAAPQPCALDSCVNDAESTCPECEQAHCDYHVYYGPDPDDHGLYCAECIEKHPLTASAMTEVYGKLHYLAEGTSLALSYTTVDGEVVATLRSPTGGKVIEASSVSGQYRVRSKSGDHTGDELTAIERIKSVVTSYLTRNGQAKEEEEEEDAS